MYLKRATIHSTVHINFYVLHFYSAGIGRTGVFIGAEIGMQQLEEKGEVDVLKIVSTLRQDRGGMVQTKDQYMFLYQVRVFTKIKLIMLSIQACISYDLTLCM